MRRTLIGAVAMVAVLGLAQTASAQNISGFLNNVLGVLSGDRDTRDLRATIWVDPDGCEHWVMDDGLEGFMSAHLDRNGKPVCRSVEAKKSICKTLESAALFASGSAALNPAARAELETYFDTVRGHTIFVNGHTDDRGAVQANLDLSLKRAMAVAKVGQAMGVNTEPRGFGEAVPVADNATSEGRARNRRVELSCS